MEEWTINSRTLPLAPGGGSVHAYIAIRDNTGRVVREYHGFQIDPETKELAVDNPASYFPGSGFALGARVFSGESNWWNPGARPADEEVFRGSRSQVERILVDLDQAEVDINQQRFEYDAVRFLSEAQNSNSVYGTLMRVADERALELGAGPIDVPERLLRDDIIRDEESRSSWAPGIHRDLLPNGLSTSTKKKKVPPPFRNK